MIYLVIGAAALAFFVWLGRSGRRAGNPGRLLWTLASVAAAGAAVFVGLRGQWFISLALVLVSLVVARGTRLTGRARRTFVPGSPPPPTTGMSLAEARDILGV